MNDTNINVTAIIKLVTYESYDYVHLMQLRIGIIKSSSNNQLYNSIHFSCSLKSF